MGNGQVGFACSFPPIPKEIAVFRVVCLLLLALPLLAALPSPSTMAQAALSHGPTVEVSMIDLAFDPKELTIPANTDVTVNVTNNGVLQHNMDIIGTDFKTEVAGGGDVQTLTVNLPAGTYAFQCDVPGHAEAGMIGTLTVVAGSADPGDDAANDETEGTSNGPDITLDLGDGWAKSDQSGLNLGERSGDQIPATVVSLSGPESSLARVVIADVDVANGRPTYDRWEAFIKTIGTGLVPVRSDSDIPDADGCLLQESVQGDEALTGARVGSTVCLTDDGRFVWASVLGEWSPDNEPLDYAEASVALTEFVLNSK